MRLDISFSFKEKCTVILENFPFCMEVMEEYSDLREEGNSATMAVRLLKEEYAAEWRDADDGALFFLGIAAAQAARHERLAEVAAESKNPWKRWRHWVLREKISQKSGTFSKIRRRNRRAAGNGNRSSPMTGRWGMCLPSPWTPRKLRRRTSTIQRFCSG